MVKAKGASIKGASIKGASIKGASIKGASIKGASIKGASIKGASIKGLRSRGLRSRGLRSRGLRSRGLRSRGLRSRSIRARHSITEHFGALDDPRIERSKRHQLLDIIIIALCGSICGADSWVHIELFGQAKEKWFRTFLELPNGIPSHDTFGDVFARIDPDQFQRCFIQWVQAISQRTQGEVVAIDGKRVRRSHDRTLGKDAIHMVNVWASGNGMALGQTKVDAKSNEVTAIPHLLEVLDLNGCIVTIDAMGCQKEIARKTVEAGADYVLAVKENQGQLHQDIGDLFQGAEAFGFEGVPYDFSRTLGKDHGRIEARECWVITESQCLDYLQTRKQWAGLKAVIKVRARRETATGASVQTRYYISSLEAPASILMEAIRSHWSIEKLPALVFRRHLPGGPVPGA